MKLLHTADWHVGRTVRGRSRADEHRAVLAELVELADRERVDATVVAGDQFDVQAPSPEAEAIVWTTLQQLAEVAPVVVIAGNHDNGRRLAAVEGLLARHRIIAGPTLRGPDDGGVVTIEARDGVTARVALLPFLHHRNAVGANALLDPHQGDADWSQAYGRRYELLARALCAPCSDDTVNVLVGHVTCMGGRIGGGEREAHTVERYSVDPRTFPPQLDYVALGHLHATQRVGAAPPVHYPGSPLALDFGETESKHALVVDLAPGRPARVSAHPHRAGRRLVTLRGPLEWLLEQEVGDDWIRTYVVGEVQAGVADEVRARLGDRVVDVRVDRPDGPRRPQTVTRVGRPPQELFRAFLDERGISDERLERLFAKLIDTEVTGASA